MSDEEKKVQEAIETAEEVTEAAEEAEEVAEVEEAKEVTEEVKIEGKPTEEKSPVEPAEKPVEKVEKEKPAPSGKFKNLIKEIESMSVIELSELVKELEERFGVSASLPVGLASAGAPAMSNALPEEEEKSAYNVVLTSSGSNKIGVIKAVREVLPDLGLKEAKDLVEAAPTNVKENMKKEEAEAAKEKLTAAGATVELQ